MSLAAMDLGPKMDWTLDNGLYQRFKVFKERCIDILSGPLHATPEENLVHYLCYWMGEEGSKFISQWTAEGKITDEDTEATSKKGAQYVLATFQGLYKAKIEQSHCSCQAEMIISGFYDTRTICHKSYTFGG